MARRLPLRSRSRRSPTMTTARRRGLRVLRRCTKVNLAIGLRWIETRMASPARSSKASPTSAVLSGGGARVSTRSMCFVRNVQTSRTKHVGLERPAGPRLRHVMFTHIAQGEVARCERRSTTCRRDPVEPRLPHAVWASSSHDDQGVTVASGNWAGEWPVTPCDGAGFAT